MTAEKDRKWTCPDCGWGEAAHPTCGWTAHNAQAVEVHQTMLCPALPPAQTSDTEADR